MKYEMIFGDEKLFDGAPEDAEAVFKNQMRETRCAYYRLSHGHERYTSGEWVKVPSIDSQTFSAMRHIIKEPKRWTVEDQKAGVLPEVGCVVMAIGVNEVARIAAINNDSVCSVCVVFEDGGFITLHFSGIAPIETPAEKAARLKSEWCAKAAKQLKNLEYTSTLTSIYDAMLSGELPPVQAKDGE